jgi:hypothetical protein
MTRRWNRLTKVLRFNIQGITKPSIRRFARQGSVKRMSDLSYESHSTEEAGCTLYGSGGEVRNCHAQSQKLKMLNYTSVSYEGVSKYFRTGHLERELQMVQLSAIKCSCIAIL